MPSEPHSVSPGSPLSLSWIGLGWGRASVCLLPPKSPPPLGPVPRPQLPPGPLYLLTHPISHASLRIWATLSSLFSLLLCLSLPVPISLSSRCPHPSLPTVSLTQLVLLLGCFSDSPSSPALPSALITAGFVTHFAEIS